MTSLNRHLISFDFMPHVTFLPRFQKKWIVVVVFLPLILLGSKFVYAQTQQPPLLVLNDTKGEYPLGLYMEILEDPSGKLRIEEVSSAAYQDRFIASDQAVVERGFTNSALWGRFQIRNTTTNTNWQLALDDTRMGLIDVYLAREDRKGFTHQQSGRLVPFNDRHSPYYLYVFDIPLQQDQAQEIYVRLKTDSTFYAPLSLWSAGTFFNHYQSRILLLGLFYGVMLIMLLYNLVLFFMLKDVNYLYLSLYIFCYGFYLAIVDGSPPSAILEISSRLKKNTESKPREKVSPTQIPFPRKPIQRYKCFRNAHYALLIVLAVLTSDPSKNTA